MFKLVCKTYFLRPLPSKSVQINNFQMENLSWKFVKNGLKCWKCTESMFFPLTPSKVYVPYTHLDVDNYGRPLKYKIVGMFTYRTVLTAGSFSAGGPWFQQTGSIVTTRVCFFTLLNTNKSVLTIFYSWLTSAFNF